MARTDQALSTFRDQESLVDHPAIMAHASVPEGERAELGISDTLIRLSVGIEDVGDLIADLDQALR
jgi:cystathionine gamma-lyase